MNKVGLNGGQRKIAEKILAEHLNAEPIPIRLTRSRCEAREEKRREEKEREDSSEWPSEGENNKMKAVPLFRLLSACWEGRRRERESAIKQMSPKAREEAWKFSDLLNKMEIARRFLSI